MKEDALCEKQPNNLNDNDKLIPPILKEYVNDCLGGSSKVLMCCTVVASDGKNDKVLLDQPYSANFSTPDPEQILKCIELDEEGDARLYAAHFGGLRRHDHSAKQWFVFNGHHWEPDKTGQVFRDIEPLINIYKKEALRQERLAREASDEEQKKVHEENQKMLNKRVRDLRKRSRKSSILWHAKNMDELAVCDDDWNTDPWLLPVKNGVVDLRSSEFRKCTPTDLIRTYTPTSWDSLHTPAPAFERFIYQILDGNEQEIKYLQRLIGYSLVGEVREHVFPILHGQHGRNGKGTLFEILKKVLDGFATTLLVETILETKNTRAGASPSPDLASIKDARLVWISEAKEQMQLDVAKVKKLCGGDTIKCRNLREKMGEFVPSHQIFLLTNDLPKVSATDDALWYRIQVLNFPLSFVDRPTKSYERKRDPHLFDKLLEEKSGILAWMVRGCLEWQRQGLNPPASVTNAVARYRRSQESADATKLLEVNPIGKNSRKKKTLNAA